MYRIFNLQELEKINDVVPTEIINFAEKILKILIKEYGELHINGDGGEIIIIMPDDDLNKLDFNIRSLIPEHSDSIKTSSGIDWVHSLVLISNDYSKHIFTRQDKASVNLLDV